MKRLVFSLILAAFATAANGQATDTAKVIELVKLMDGENVGPRILKLMESEIRKNAPMLDSMFYVELHELANFDQLIKKQVPLYSKFYTDNEIKELIRFYKTPVGKKTIAVLPELTVEALNIGQQWGQDLVAVLIDRYKRRMKDLPKVDVEVRDDQTESPIPPPPPPVRNGK